jgi:hypothetical protein
MTNPRTIDRRDVAHQTNPVGDHETIEEANTNLAEPEKNNPGRMAQKRAAGREVHDVQSPDNIA